MFRETGSEMFLPHEHIIDPARKNADEAEAFLVSLHIEQNKDSFSQAWTKGCFLII